MAEYEKRQSQFPDEIGATLAAFLGGLQRAHHDNIITELEFADHITKIKNVEIKLQLGLLDAEQALVYLLSLPASEYCDDEGFGLDTAKVNMNMRVNAHSEDKKTDTGAVDSHTDVSASAGFGPFGHAKVKQSITGHYSHSGEQAHSSDYSAYTEIEVTMKRTSAPPARRIVSQFVQEGMKDAGELVKARVQIMKGKMQDELGNKDVPKEIPPEKDKGDDNGSDESDNGSDDTPDDNGNGNGSGLGFGN